MVINDDDLPLELSYSSKKRPVINLCFMSVLKPTRAFMVRLRLIQGTPIKNV